jgi:hypothetical protein
LETSIRGEILNSIVTAKLFVGDREFAIPVNAEIVKVLSSCKLQDKDITTEMTQFMRWYLTNRVSPCSIDIDGITIPFKLPSYLFDSIEMAPRSLEADEILIDEFGAILRNMIPSGMRPPTDRQIWFAKKIAFALEIKLTEQDLKTVTSCSEFIEDNQMAFRTAQTRMNEFSKDVRLAGKGYIAHELQNHTKSLDSVRELMRVSKLDTIEKYLSGFSSFLSAFHQQCSKTKEVSIIIINELIENSYEHIDVPFLTLEKIEQIILDSK